MQQVPVGQGGLETRPLHFALFLLVTFLEILTPLRHVAGGIKEPGEDEPARGGAEDARGGQDEFLRVERDLEGGEDLRPEYGPFLALCPVLLSHAKLLQL